MHIADAEGNELPVRIIEVQGSSALVEHRQCPHHLRQARNHTTGS
ncbi:MAG: hypothetical protein OXE42_04500 [Gammaproteobacteria bacterium]|nr:hypothetical protein [Gammaproteobacteria bacterium]